jgi:hypothetical protein
MRALFTEEIVIGIAAFQRTSSVPAMLFAVGADLGIRALHALFGKVPFERISL